MTPSRRFVVASFFAAIALSALCNSIFSIIDSSFGDQPRPLNVVALLYSVSLAMFMIKYFVDDVIDDRHDDSERITRNSLALMVVAWTLFILSALFAKDVFMSAVCWAAGLASITVFLYRNRKLVEHHARLYLTENGLLLATLVVLAVASFRASRILESPSALATRTFPLSALVATGLLVLLNGSYFIVMLRDDTKPRQ